MFGRLVWNPTEVTLDPNAGIYLKSGRSVGEDQLDGAGALPKFTSSHGIYVDAGSCVEEIVRKAGDRKARNGL